MTVAQVRKAIVASVGAIVILVVAVPEIFGEWLSPEVTAWIVSIAAVLIAIGVYLVKNAHVIDKIGTGAYRNPPPEEGELGLQ